MKKNVAVIFAGAIIVSAIGGVSVYSYVQYDNAKNQITDNADTSKNNDIIDPDILNIDSTLGKINTQNSEYSKVSSSLQEESSKVSELTEEKSSGENTEVQSDEPSTDSSILVSESSFSESVVSESEQSTSEVMPPQSELSDIPVSPNVSTEETPEINSEVTDETGSTDIPESSNENTTSQSEKTSEVTEQPVKPNGKIDISECKIVIDDSNNKNKDSVPELEIYHNNKKLVCNKDYIAEFKKMPGNKKYLKVTMLGKYEGSLKQEYSILPTATAIYRVSPKVSDIGLRWLDSSKTSDGYEIGISENSDMSDETVYNVEGGKTTQYNISDLVQNKIYYLRIRSYKNSDDGRVKICSAWSSVKTAEMKKVEVINGVTYIDGILIANKTYSLPENYGSGLDKTALAAFNKMAADAGNDGLYLFIVSGFRSYQVQNSTYSYFCSERGVTAADRVSARPGHSEHQTGLAMDVNSTAFSFADTPEAKWLADNCWKYGFVIRYPQGKEDITGYAYEAWHIRYLGKELAKELYESGLTLEEYLGITSQYS